MPRKKLRVTKNKVQKSQPISHSGKPSIGDSVKQGFGLGVGLEGARAAIGGISGMFSSNEPEPSANNEPETCGFEKQLIHKCLDESNQDVDKCKEVIELLNSCYKNK